MITVEEIHFEIERRLKVLTGQSSKNYDAEITDSVLNEAQSIFFEKLVDFAGESARVAGDLAPFLVKAEKLTPENKTDQAYIFPLPVKYYRNQGEYAYCSKGSCKLRLFELHRMPGFKIPSMLRNTDWMPSWEWGETFWDESQRKMYVYADNKFSVDSVYLDYYRHPQKVISKKYYAENAVDPSTGRLYTQNQGLEVAHGYAFRRIMDIFQLIIARDRKDSLDFNLEVQKLLSIKNLFI